MMEGFMLYEGRQFVFVRPGEKVKISRWIDGDGRWEELDIDRPTILPRYRADISFLEGTFSGIDFDRLALSAVVSDRKLYKTGETARIFAFCPPSGGSAAVIEVRCNNLLVQKEEMTLDGGGTLQLSLEGLSDGNYQVSLAVSGQKAQCAFTVAGYSLSFLRASLQGHTYDGGILQFSLSIAAGDIPCSGNVKVGLFCGYCGYVVAETDATAKDGLCQGEFTLSGHTGPFTVVVTTGEGDTASVPVPGTEASVRERISLSRLGEIVEGGILPFENSQGRVRGIYVGSAGAESGPVMVDSIVGQKTGLRVLEDLDHLVLCFFEPSSGSFTVREHRDLKTGEALSIDIPYPLSILMTGAMGKSCHESYCLLMRPEGMELEVTAPGKARPGEEVEIVVASPRRGRLLLVAADSRLERDDPMNVLTECLYGNVRSSLAKLGSGKVEKYEQVVYRSMPRMGFDMAMPSHAMAPPAFRNISLAAAPALPESISLGGLMMADSTGAPDLDNFSAAASLTPPGEEAHSGQGISSARMDFPHLLMAEMLDFDGRLKKKLKLGDQVGSFLVYAFLVDGFDYASASAQIETSQELYVELDVPSLMSPGDEIICRAIARCPGKGRVVIRTSQDVLEADVDGSGRVEFPLRAGGEVMAQVDWGGEGDVTSRTVGVPGREKVTVTSLRWLEPGEVLEGEKILVYPGIGHLVRDSVESLIQYPFGCAEQTSAKLYGLALVLKAVKAGAGGNGRGRVERLLRQGAQRMSLFFRDGRFSMWEGGRPDSTITRQVLRNLVPLRGIDLPGLGEMMEAAASCLLKEKVRDNGLVAYSGEFAGEMKSIRDAAAFYRQGLQREKALALVREKAEIEGDMAVWQDGGCWAGPVEATCHALQVACREDRPLFDKGFRYVGGRLQKGMLFTTTDTCAFLELLDGMDSGGTARAVLDGKEMLLDAPVFAGRVEALERVLVRQDTEKEVDMLSPRSGLDGEVTLGRTFLALGEKTVVKITPGEKTMAPLARVYLPGNVACLQGGGEVQKLYLPVEGDSLSLEVYGIRKGTGRMRVALHDMYDSEKASVLPGISIKVG
jgi:hypothetical protein